NLLAFPVALIAIAHNAFTYLAISSFDSDTQRADESNVRWASSLVVYRGLAISFVTVLTGMAMASGWIRVFAQRVKLGLPIFRENHAPIDITGGKGINRSPIPGLTQLGGLSE